MSTNAQLVEAAREGRLEGVQRALADGADIETADAVVSEDYSIVMSSCVRYVM